MVVVEIGKEATGQGTEGRWVIRETGWVLSMEGVSWAMVGLLPHHPLCCILELCLVKGLRLDGQQWGGWVLVLKVSLQVPSFPPVVAPCINPNFFGWGLAPGGNGIWSDPNMARWGGEEQSSNGEDATSDRQHEKGAMGIRGWLKGIIMVLQREGVKRRKMRVLDRTGQREDIVMRGRDTTRDKEGPRAEKGKGEGER